LLVAHGCALPRPPPLPQASSVSIGRARLLPCTRSEMAALGGACGEPKRHAESH
jgi:hypothetical protein